MKRKNMKGKPRPIRRALTWTDRIPFSKAIVFPLKLAVAVGKCLHRYLCK